MFFFFYSSFFLSSWFRAPFIFCDFPSSHYLPSFLPSFLPPYLYFTLLLPALISLVCVQVSRYVMINVATYCVCFSLFRVETTLNWICQKKKKKWKKNLIWRVVYFLHIEYCTTFLLQPKKRKVIVSHWPTPTPTPLTHSLTQ